MNAPTANRTGKEVVALRNEILSTVEKYGDQLKALAPRGTTVEHYLASTRLYLASNPRLLECRPSSIAIGLLRIAQTGLELGSSADLLPFKKECVFAARYNGIVELALAAGTRAINADVVREGDTFHYQQGTRFLLDHQPNHEVGAKILAAYAIAELKPQSFVGRVMSRDELIAHKNRYSLNPEVKAAALDDIAWYCRKTMVHAIKAFLPKNARLAAALMFTESAEAQADGDTIEGERIADVPAKAEPPQPVSQQEREKILERERQEAMDRELAAGEVPF